MAGQTTTDAYVEVTGSRLDTNYGQRFVGFQLQEMAGVNGITFKVQGSLEATPDTVAAQSGAAAGGWVDLSGHTDQAGSVNAGSTVAVAANATAYAFISQQLTNSSLSLWRWYRLVVKSTVGGSPGSARGIGFSKGE